jgi:SHS2 domain-containing protein
MKEFYRQIAHTADIGIEVWANSISELFINSARALFDIMVGLENIKVEEKEEKICVDGLDKEDLLVRWLNELIYIFSVQKDMFCEYEVKYLDDFKFECICKGEKFKDGIHELKNEIKAATYHGIQIRQRDGLYITEIIFDV